ncbi:MAG: enoyl-CoA hydratase/isomerase family protein [Phenylobacterium sp.]|uniref:enoyl-CoA hydratase/isomerase family protein n=1 Tax=Phenylobacterium sp. TaxID=1871053 RepID=UPI001A4031DE|nr:enoyl-CoA hydratase-related protein [Phenylobacterium sp.]MBL8772095.1 enoyl-CoA hydratase/isomerase family protein [Phenylobacterium sp.]
MTHSLDAQADPGGPPVRLTRDGAVAVLTLNRPDAANTIDAPLAAAFRETLEALDGDESVRALLLQGEGRMFCAGGDLTSFAEQGLGAARYVEGLIADLHAGLERLFAFHAPVVAAVHGAAAGAGLGLAMAADLVIAGENARFVMAYTRSGLTPDGGTSWALPRLVGLRRALELTYLNPTLTAAEARDQGLVTEVVPDSAVGARAGELARELAAGPTAAYAAARRLLRESIRPEYAAHLRREAVGIVEAFSSRDGLEGVRAFQERRAPVFHGR